MGSLENCCLFLAYFKEYRVVFEVVITDGQRQSLNVMCRYATYRQAQSTPVSALHSLIKVTNSDQRTNAIDPAPLHAHTLAGGWTDPVSLDHMASSHGNRTP